MGGVLFLGHPGMRPGCECGWNLYNWLTKACKSGTGMISTEYVKVLPSRKLIGNRYISHLFLEVRKFIRHANIPWGTSDMFPPRGYLWVQSIWAWCLENNMTRWWFQIFCFHPYSGKWSNLTNIFQMGWNHRLDEVVKRCRLDTENMRIFAESDHSEVELWFGRTRRNTQHWFLQMIVWLAAWVVCFGIPLFKLWKSEGYAKMPNFPLDRSFNDQVLVHFLFFESTYYVWLVFSMYYNIIFWVVQSFLFTCWCLDWLWTYTVVKVYGATPTRWLSKLW